MRASLSAGFMSLILASVFAFQASADSGTEAITPDSIFIQRCSACHYVDGTSPGPEFPKIAGQYEVYLNKALKQFKEHNRESDTMELITSLHKQQELVIIANYFANQKADEKPAIISPNASLKERGEHIYKSERVYGISCENCHGPDGKGYVRTSPRTTAKRAIPRLAGQRPAYLLSEIEKYRTDRRQHGMCAMRKASKTLSQNDIKALVEYLSSK